MAKENLQERFQQLAGLKPLYEVGSLTEQSSGTPCYTCSPNNQSPAHSDLSIGPNSQYCMNPFVGMSSTQQTQHCGTDCTQVDSGNGFFYTNDSNMACPSGSNTGGGTIPICYTCTTGSNGQMVSSNSGPAENMGSYWCTNQYNQSTTPCYIWMTQWNPNGHCRIDGFPNEFGTPLLSTVAGGACLSSGTGPQPILDCADPTATNYNSDPLVIGCDDGSGFCNDPNITGYNPQICAGNTSCCTYTPISTPPEKPGGLDIGDFEGGDFEDPFGGEDLGKLGENLVKTIKETIKNIKRRKK